jgi:hypothetical protein
MDTRPVKPAPLYESTGDTYKAELAAYRAAHA